MTMKFIDTFENNAYINPESYEKAHLDAEQAEKDGFVKVPPWFPVPLPDCYECKIFGQMLAYMKPKPKLRHKIRFIGHRILAWRQEREIKKIWKDAQKTCNK